MVRPALEKTLKTLQLDYVDLYIIELPIAFKVSKEPLCCNRHMQHLDCILSVFKLLSDIIIKENVRCSILSSDVYFCARVAQK